MNLCSDCHGEVCYSGRDCPACELVRELEKAEMRIHNLEEEGKEPEGKENV